MSIRKKILIIFLIFILVLLSIYFIFIKDNKSQKIKNTKENDNYSFNLNPFGDDNKKVNNNNTKIKSDNNIEQKITSKYEVKEMPRLRQITKEKVAGIFLEYLTKQELHKINVDNEFFGTEKAWKWADNISEIRYVLQKNGYIYKTYTNTDLTINILNTLIPKIYSVKFWDKNNFIIQYQDENEGVKNYFMNLTKKPDEQIKEEKEKKMYREGLMNFSGHYYPSNLSDYTLSIQNGKRKIFYLQQTDKGVDGIISDEWGGGKTKIFESPLKEWDADWNKNSKYIYLNTSPSSNTFSISFKLNSNNGNVKKIHYGLWAGNGKPNHSFTKILYSFRDVTDKNNKLAIFDLKTLKFKKINLGTYIEKCVWSNDDKYIYCAVPTKILSKDDLNNWYQGKIDFNDDIYKINVDNNEMEIIFNSYEYGNNFDIKDLKIDDFDKFLYFIDWNTQTPWIYRINKEDKKEEIEIEKKDTKNKLGGGKKCKAEMILHENLKPGDRDGKYSSWQKAKITEVKILQKHMNRLGFNAGKVDGILGRNTKSAIMKMQKFLGTTPDGYVGPKTRALLNNSCN